MISKSKFTDETNFWSEVNDFVQKNIIDQDELKKNCLLFWKKNNYSFHDVHYFCYLIRELSKSVLFSDNGQTIDPDPRINKIKTFLINNLKKDYKVQISNFISKHGYNKNEKNYFAFTLCDTLTFHVTFVKFAFIKSIQKVNG
jgi:uncharacterized protein YeeX (DUF496 family)